MDILGTLKRLAGNRLTQKQKLVMRRIAELDSELTMSALIRQIAQEESMGESTARVVIQALRDIGLIACGTENNKGVPVRLTPIGEVLVQGSNGKSLETLRQKINLTDSLSLISHAINFSIFIYFIIFLLKLDALDLFGLSISAFGLFVSLIANIMSVLESRSR